MTQRHSYYSFPTLSGTEGISHPSSTKNKGQATFQRMWPNLPREMHVETGLLVDYIIRDYITCWYTHVDDGVRYEDEKVKRKRLGLDINLGLSTASSFASFCFL